MLSLQDKSTGQNKFYNMISENKISAELEDYNYAFNLESSKYFKEAYKIFLKLFENESFDSGDLAFHCGWCLENINQGRTTEVISYYQKAGETATDLKCRYNAYFRTGWVHLQLKDYRKSAEAFKKVIDISDSFDDDIVQNAIYWYALSLESLGCYLEAVKWYRIVADICPSLNPESRRREITCLINVGLFKDALKVCYTFYNPPPNPFNRERYLELKKYAEKEIKLLELSF
jgi:tetratricopeptide (TPR) repeat protein